MQCIETFKKIQKNNYIINAKYEDGTSEIIEFSFKPKHFHHLIGLQHLTDIQQVKETETNPAYAIYRNIVNGYIRYSALKRSAYFFKVKDRIEYFNQIESVILSKKLIINFDPQIVDGPTKLHSKYLFYKPIDCNNSYLHLGINTDVIEYYPETYLYEPSKRYISGQDLIEIDIEVEPFRAKHIKRHP